jgi:hypothetical protein
MTVDTPVPCGTVFCMPGQSKYTLEFYEDPDSGDHPALRWINEGLTPVLRRLLGAAMREILQKEGASVCQTDFGKQLGDSVFEFRVNGDPQPIIDQERKRRGKQAKRVDPPAEKVLLRVFCHAYGNRIVLLLGGYDKAKDDSAKRQNAEIIEAKRRLARWRHAQNKRASKLKRGKPGKRKRSR